MQYRDQQPDIRTFGRHDGGDKQPTEQLPVAQAGQQPPERRGRGMKVVIWLMSLVIIAIVLLVGARIASENIVKPMVGDRVERELGTGVETFVNQELSSLPAASSDSPQQYFVSEAEINQRIAAQSNLGPLDDATAEINDDGIVVHLQAYRMSGTYSANVEAADGAVTLKNGSLSGPLSYVIPVGDLEQVANDAILQSLATSNLHVTDVTLYEGEMVLSLEPAESTSSSLGRE